MSKINTKTENIVTGSDNLSEIIRILTKEVKQEDDNLHRVLLCGLSAFTPNPINMRILAPVGEGKTHILKKVSQIFPTDYVAMLSTASSQALKYGNGMQVIEEKGNYVSLQSKIKSIQEKLDKDSKDYKTNLDKATKSLQNKSWNLIDLGDKWMIFLDSQDPKLWEFLKTILSQDTEYIKHLVTNRQSGGGNKQQRIVFRGKPSVIYASAKDESRSDLTGEIETRFQTISLQANPLKYKQSNQLLAKQYGLVGPIYGKEVVSKDQLERAKKLVSSIIKTLRSYQGEERPVLNPFSDVLAKNFPSDNGFRARQFERFLRTCNLVTLCNAEHRSKIQIDNKKYPITHITDVSNAATLIIENTGLPSYKIQKFNDVIKPAILEHGEVVEVDGESKTVLTASEILTWFTVTNSNYSRKKLLETFLTPLFNHGFLSKTKDPRDRARDIFWIPESFENQNATTESTLINTSTLDEQCVELFLKEHIVSRYSTDEYQFYNTKEETISVAEIAKQVTMIDIQSVETSFKN